MTTGRTQEGESMVSGDAKELSAWGGTIRSNGSRTKDEVRSLCYPEIWNGWQHQGSFLRSPLGRQGSEAGATSEGTRVPHRLFRWGQATGKCLEPITRTRVPSGD